jgi:predicted CXXCH cytochrome family protein
VVAPEAAPEASQAAASLTRLDPVRSSDSCLICHDFDPVLSHPVGVSPPASMAVPADLPLERGLVSCVTCHSGISEDHATSLTRAPAFNATAHADASLCLRCHDATGSSAREMHAAALGRAHLPGSHQGWAARNASESAVLSSASSSTRCLTCHDGAMASDATARTGAVLLGMPSQGSQAHPVAVEYRLTDPGFGDGALRPESMLDPRVRLFDHRVECASCHSPYSSEPRLLVMSNQGSQLCLSCHDL